MNPRPFRTALLGLLLAPWVLAQEGPVSRDAAVMVDVASRLDPPAVTLRWLPNRGATGYRIYRKAPDAKEWAKPIASLPADATTYEDSGVQAGETWEYRVESAIGNRNSNGYVLAGLNAPLEDHRGTVLLLIETILVEPLADEIARLEADLIGDGWEVIRHVVDAADSPVKVRGLIQEDFRVAPDSVRAVFLLGHVPVPYSGDLNPDGHPEHRGAWPADAYYGDVDGEWPDTAVNNDGPARRENRNIPGDGRFDPSYLPSDVELMVGRVDMANLRRFGAKETELTRRYLDKNHAFRHASLDVPRRALIQDEFGWFHNGQAFAASGWRSFAPLVGKENIAEGPLLQGAREGSYLWVYGGGPGSYTNVGRVLTTDDLHAKPFHGVFAFLFGSYHGDWDSHDNVMRAALAAEGTTLVCAWSGFPHWFVHPMGLGRPIGHCARLSQNNLPLYQGPALGWSRYSRGVHVALLGDPTLRLHPVKPPGELKAMIEGVRVKLSWSTSPAPGLVGYHVYRAPVASGPFVRLTPTPITATEFEGLDEGGGAYQVRAVALEESPSGTYFNQSQGVFTVSAPATP